MSTFYDPGLYEVQIVGQGLTESSTGTPTFFLVFEVLAVQDLKDKEFYKVETTYERTMYKALTANTIDYVLPDLQRLGFEGTKLSQLDPNSRDAFLFEGVIQLYCKHEEYNGKWRERWNLPMEERNVDALDGKKLKELDALFGAKVKQFFGNGKKQKSAAPAEAEDDESIPF